ANLYSRNYRRLAVSLAPRIALYCLARPSSAVTVSGWPGIQRSIVFLLARIDSNERAGTDERGQGVVVHSDVSVQRIGAIHLLKHERDFIPSFQYLGHEVSPLHTQFLS